MVKIKTKVKICIISAISIVAGFEAAAIARLNVSANSETRFNISVAESLTVSVTQPAEWATGNVGTFLRNKVNLTVTANNTLGYNASMRSDTTEELVNIDDSNFTIPTLTGSYTRANFPDNHWGFSTDDDDDGFSGSTYKAMSTGATTIKYSSRPVEADSTDIYFGTKINTTQAAGTYTNDVIISVVTGVPNPEQPSTPTDPIRPGDGDGAQVRPNTTVSSNTTTNDVAGTETETTEVTYKPPLGVVDTTYTTNVANGVSLTTGLLVASATAATSSLLFFALAKRRKDDEDEEDL